MDTRLEIFLSDASNNGTTDVHDRNLDIASRLEFNSHSSAAQALDSRSSRSSGNHRHGLIHNGGFLQIVCSTSPLDDMIIGIMHVIPIWVKQRIDIHHKVNNGLRLRKLYGIINILAYKIRGFEMEFVTIRVIAIFIVNKYFRMRNFRYIRVTS